MTDQEDDIKLSVRDGEVLMLAFGDEWRMNAAETRQLIRHLQEAEIYLDAIGHRIGRTTMQMKVTKVGGLYFVPRMSVGYMRHLAHHLNRNDLYVRPIDELAAPAQFIGAEWSDVTVDHACDLTPQYSEALRRLRPYIGRK